MTDREKQLEEALEKIRQITLLHFIGGAFDPEHMRAISNYCCGILNKEPCPQDLDEAPEPVIVELLRDTGWTYERR